MTRTLVHRPARVVRPLAPPPDVPVAAPPQMNDAAGGSGLQSMLPVVGAVGSMTMMLVLRGNPLFVLVGVMVLVVALVGGVGMALSHRGTAARGRRLQRERYLDYLEGLRSDLRDAENDARDVARTVHPDPVALVDVVRDPERRWERRRTDPDFLDLRVGAGDRPWFDLRVPEDPNPTQPFDPAMAAEAEAVRVRHGRVPQMPITVPLDRVGEVAVIGPRDACLAVVRALTVQAVALHAPDDLQVAATFSADRAGDWAWLGAVPHVVDDALFDGPVPARRVAADLPGLVRVVGPSLVDRAQAAARVRRGGTGVSASAGYESRLLVLADGHGAVAGVLPPVDAALGLADLGRHGGAPAGRPAARALRHRAAPHGRRGRHGDHRGPARRAPGAGRRDGRRRLGLPGHRPAPRAGAAAPHPRLRRWRRTRGRGRHRRAAGRHGRDRHRRRTHVGRPVHP
ncbi:hypothetical protein [Cellulomonas sp.]|uniref:hypothetical protein n=1 Tax=Cellulomonas sp. TaxID=40001 RepID=UPI003BABAD79